MTETGLSPATSGAEDSQTSAPATPRETPNDSGCQREGSGGSVPNLCPGMGDETDAVLAPKSPSRRRHAGTVSDDDADRTGKKRPSRLSL